MHICVKQQNKPNVDLTRNMQMCQNDLYDEKLAELAVVTRVALLYNLNTDQSPSVVQREPIINNVELI